ncbi:MAG: hypothetical protein KME22_06595 [Hassallia sp. WJT32-NPBG1]|jgi:hypothetical protein|nr:hypothetical protein [Hassallia sp. WJT32-NPBG1]
MFTKSQLNLMIQSQWGDDWTAQYFLQRLVFMAPDADISGAEFDELINILNGYSIEQIEKLQMALMYLLDI